MRAYGANVELIHAENGVLIAKVIDRMIARAKDLAKDDKTFRPAVQSCWQKRTYLSARAIRSSRLPNGAIPQRGRLIRGACIICQILKIIAHAEKVTPDGAIGYEDFTRRYRLDPSGRSQKWTCHGLAER